MAEALRELILDPFKLHDTVLQPARATARRAGPRLRWPAADCPRPADRRPLRAVPIGGLVVVDSRRHGRQRPVGGSLRRRAAARRAARAGLAPATAAVRTSRRRLRRLRPRGRQGPNADRRRGMGTRRRRPRVRDSGHRISPRRRSPWPCSRVAAATPSRSPNSSPTPRSNRERTTCFACASAWGCRKARPRPKHRTRGVVRDLVVGVAGFEPANLCVPNAAL